MIRKIVFSVICALYIPPILMPGDRVDMAESTLVCPSGAKLNDEVKSASPLEKWIQSQLSKAKTSASRMDFTDVYIRLDAESLYCYERNEEVVLEAFVTLTWHSTFICWDPDDFGNVENVTLKHQELGWLPKIISYTKSIETFDVRYQLANCIVSSNGTVSCWMVVFVNGPCKMYLRAWPERARAECRISLDILDPTGRQKLLHRDDRTSYEWLRSANKGNPGQFIAVYVRRETERNGVVFRFYFRATTSAFAHAIVTVAVVLNVVLIASFALPAGSSARMSLLGCASISLLLSLGFLENQLSSVTPDTPIIVRIHGNLLVIAGIALLPATLLAPRLVPTKPYSWQLRCRSWLLSSPVGRFILLIFRVPNPSGDVAPLGEEGQQSASFQEDDSSTSQGKDDPTRTLLYTLTDRVLGALCCISFLGVWWTMLYGPVGIFEDMYYTALGAIMWGREDLGDIMDDSD